jgi:hypothetical protein
MKKNSSPRKITLRTEVVAHLNAALPPRKLQDARGGVAVGVSLTCPSLCCTDWG